MTILLLLVPISVVLLGLAIGAFVWAVRSGQFENLDSAALDVLVDEVGPPCHAQRRAAPDASPASGGASRETHQDRTHAG